MSKSNQNANKTTTTTAAQSIPQPSGAIIDNELDAFNAETFGDDVFSKLIV